MQGKFSGMQKSRFVTYGKILMSNIYAICFRNFQMDLRDHEKNNFKNIVVDLRMLDKLSSDSDVIPLCLSLRDSQIDQNTKHGMPKWL
jgi:hypothetical protein